MSTPDPLVVAYAEEYAMCKASGQDARLLTVAEELTRRGWYIDDDGNLGEIQQQAEPERADVGPAPENTAEPAPKRRSPRAKQTTATPTDAGSEA